MKITVDVLSKESIEAAIKAVEAFGEKVKKLETELPKALAEFGKVQARAEYDWAPYNLFWDNTWDDTPSISVRAEQTDKGWSVIANGEEVCFLEFGAGVFFEQAGNVYQGTRPPGVVGIGEYGYGLGKNELWSFEKGGAKQWTHGTPPSNALYHTAEEIKRRVEETARRILNDDRH